MTGDGAAKRAAGKHETHLLGESQEQGLILHPLQVQIGVGVQHLQALEELIIQPLNEAHQVPPHLQFSPTLLSHTLVSGLSMLASGKIAMR